jgi:uroporphyrinogen-III synthase
MSRRVLVTRAEPGASETAGRLRARGYVPLVEPMFTVEPLPAVLPDFDALAFTSANGVRIFAKLSPRRDVPVFCVGGRTAVAAREAGFDSVTSADGDVTALIAVIETKVSPAARLLHSGNEDSRGDLAGTLRAKGRKAEFAATYRALPVAGPGPALAAHISGHASFDYVLVHSPRGAAILKGLVETAGNLAPFGLAAISQAASAPVAPFARHIEIAASPDEAALLDALKRLSVSS